MFYVTVHYKLFTEQSSSLSYNTRRALATGFSNATDQQKIQAFIKINKRSKNVGFCNSELHDFASLCAKADKDLTNSTAQSINRL